MQISNSISRMYLYSYLSICMVSVLIGSQAFASANSKAVEQPVLVIEPSFVHPPITHRITGAERTIIVPAMLEKKNDTARPTISFLKTGWKTMRPQYMHSFIEQARSQLSEILATLHPQFLRDEHNVIQVALLESTNPLTASTILAPHFAEQFTPIFGPELLIAIPSAYRVYVFSKLASPLESIAPAIRDDYKFSPAPVSTEIFELGKNPLQAIGSLD